MEDLDIQALAEKIGDHRFNGYTDSMLADEIDRFRSGRGTSGLGDAVDALQAVAAALAETDRTLRTELGKLGVEWHGAAATHAGAAITGHATFCEEAGENVTIAAKHIFAQGEAFNRTLHTLPESQALRGGTGGYSVLDSVGSLLGFETDNAQQAAKAREARELALQALNTYARRSGELLSGIRTLDAPPTLHADTGPAMPGVPGTGDVTTSAGAGAPVAPGSPAPTGGAAGTSVHSAPGSAVGLPAQGALAGNAGSGAAGAAAASRQPTTASGTAGTATSASASVGVVGAAGLARAGQAGRSTASPSGGIPGAGGAVPGAAGLAGTPGSAVAVPGPAERPVGGSLGAAPGGSAAHGSGSGAAAGRAPGAGSVSAPPHTGGTAGKPATLAAPGETQQPLPKGKSTGSGPVPSGIPAGGFSGAEQAAADDGWSENAIGAGVTALGAGGIAGALSGDGERKGRGVGRSAPRAAGSLRPLPVGDLPEEEERVQRTSSRLGESPARTRDAFLREAAPRTDDDAEPVRRFGVDDTDLFTDERRVAPDVIGDTDPRP